MTVALVETQAEILHALGAAGGRLPLDAERAAAWAGALEDLEHAGLVELAPGPVLIPGGRGSVLDAREIEAACSDAALGRPVEVRASVTSTNDFVLDRALQGARPGLVCVAELQTAGRGRRGRAFDSRPGLGIWSTTLLDAPDDPALAPRLSLVAALAVAQAVESCTGRCPGIKWPNDVRLSGRKISGILVEARCRGRALFPVAGIGVNVHHRPDEFPPELRALAGSVEGVTGRRVRRGALLAAILRELSRLLAADRCGELNLPDRFDRFDELRGASVAVAQGSSTLRGVASGIEEDGCLRLAIPGGDTHRVRAGEATLSGG